MILPICSHNSSLTYVGLYITKNRDLTNGFCYHVKWEIGQPSAQWGVVLTVLWFLVFFSLPPQFSSIVPCLVNCLCYLPESIYTFSFQDLPSHAAVGQWPRKAFFLIWGLFMCWFLVSDLGKKKKGLHFVGISFKWRFLRETTAFSLDFLVSASKPARTLYWARVVTPFSFGAGTWTVLGFGIWWWK